MSNFRGAVQIVCFGCGSYAQIPTEFSMPNPTQRVFWLVAGPDGNMWFSGQYRVNGADGSGYVGQITPSGAITIYPLPANVSAGEVVLGPDKALWFLNEQGGFVGKQLARFQVLG